jgi:hypothetical protein
VLPHALDEALDAHLTSSDVNDGIDQVQVGKLAVGSVIDYVH